jgi:hypothetical protein
MTTDEQARRKAQAVQKATRALNLIRAGGLIVIGVVGILATVSGALFANAGSGQAQGWLYDNLGKDGATAAAIGLFALLILVGGIWAFRIVRRLRTG